MGFILVRNVLQSITNKAHFIGIAIMIKKSWKPVDRKRYIMAYTVRKIIVSPSGTLYKCSETKRIFRNKVANRSIYTNFVNLTIKNAKGTTCLTFPWHVPAGAKLPRPKRMCTYICTYAYYFFSNSMYIYTFHSKDFNDALI